MVPIISSLVVKLSITITYHCHLHHKTACIASEHFVYNVHMWFSVTTCDVTGIHIYTTHACLVEFPCLISYVNCIPQLTMLGGQCS